MATTTPSRPPHLADAQRKLRSPLARLRGYIHAYVSLEGAALILLLLAVWFWVGLALDYLPFALVRLDWLDVLPLSVRALFLVALVGVVTYFVQGRVRLYLAQFRDPALALLLERKFPRLLGDRLITAVELADPKMAAQYGYSVAMVEETIREAAARVDDVPVREVFDWGRLLRRGLLTLAGVVGFYLVVAAGVMSVSAVRERGAWRGLHNLNDVLLTYIERDFLLQKVFWKGDVQLVVVSPADNHRLSVEGKVVLEVRANKTMVADRSAPRGWRQATWKDLEDHPEFVGGETPRRAPPESWLAFGKPLTTEGVDQWHAQLTVDEVEVRLRQFRVRSVERADGVVRWERSPSGVGENDWRPLLWRELRDQTGGMNLPTVFPDVYPAQAAPLAAAEFVTTVFSPTLGGAAGLLVSLPGEDQLTFDEVVRQLPALVERRPEFEAAAKDVRSLQAHLERLAVLEGVLERVARAAAEPAQSRTLRQLTVPDVVKVEYSLGDARSDLTLRKDPNNPLQYVGIIEKLKEGEYTYRASAGDYRTTPRHFTALGPPTLTQLFSQERHPAYLFARAARLTARPDAQRGESDRDFPSLSLAAGPWVAPEARASWDALELRGKRQALPPVNMTNYPGAVLQFDVPVSSDVLLTGQTSRPLQRVQVEPPLAGQAVVVGEDRFTVRIPNIRDYNGQNLRIEFYDTDGIKGERKVQVRARRDDPPRLVDIQPVRVRSTKQGTFLVTATAHIPFQGRVEDDHGLKEIRYRYQVFKKNLPTLVPPPPPLAALLPTGIEVYGPAAPDELLSRGSALLPGLAEEQTRARAPHLTPADLALRLSDVKEGARLRDAFLKVYDLKPYALDKKNGEVADDRNHFSVAALGLKTPDDYQLPYRVVVTVEATDYDVEGPLGDDGLLTPHTTASDAFSFLVLDPYDLVREIDKEETDLLKKVEFILKQLEAEVLALPKDRADLAKLELRDKKILDGVRERLDHLRTQLDNDHTALHEIRDAYDRIVEEIRLNELLAPTDRELISLKTEVVRALHDLDANLKDRDRNDPGSGEYFDRAALSAQHYVEAVAVLQQQADNLDKAQTRAKDTAEQLQKAQQALAEGKGKQEAVDKAKKEADKAADDLKKALAPENEKAFQQARADAKTGVTANADQAEADLRQLRDKVKALYDQLTIRAGFKNLIKRRLEDFSRREGSSSEALSRQLKKVRDELNRID